MPITPNKIQLSLTNSQTQNLLQLQQQLGEKLEQWGSLRPEMLADLTTEMKQVLEGQAEYPDIATQARNRQSRLHLTHNDPNILNLPWRLATQGLRLLYLTKGKNTPEDLPILEADNPPLKILVMISSPENASYESRLNYEEEEDQIIRAFAPLFDSGEVQIDFTDDGSLDNLAEKIAANRYHILHFSGHGVYHKEQQKSYLALEDSLTMHQELVEAEKFAEVFQRKPQNMPALIVLSSCQTAKGGTEQGMKSVTDELLLKGLPAVISMSVSVTDYFATYFAGVLYKQLAQKEPLFRAFQSAIGATQQHEIQRLPNHPPSQWMIPQLFVSQQVEQPVDFSKAAQNLHYSAWKFVSGKEGLQTQKRSNYQFVGRRRDRKRIFQSWEKRRAILLKGQGGVGKTAMAEYVLQRLVAKNPHFHAFIFNEYSANMSNVIAELEKFLKDRKLRKLVLALRKEHKDNAYEHFEALFAEAEERSQPLFIFDNLESFQSAPGAAFRTELADSLTKIIDFCYTEDIPLILTCRYSVAECPDIPTSDLNQVEPNDFLKKALQMSLQTLPRKIRQQGLAHLLNEQKLTFREVITWLHETFGGNYQALEFFDEVFAQKKNKLPQALKTLADFKQQYADAEIETRQLMSKNLLFEELLKLLEEDEKTALRLLSRFRIPVLVTALQMQKHDLDYPSIFDSLQELTLLEQHRDVEQPVLQYFYVTPLVKDLVKGAFEKEEEIGFSAELAGRYHKWIAEDINKRSLGDLEEAFDFFVEAKNGKQLNEIGRILCDFYNGIAQFKKTYRIGQQVYKQNNENTDWNILHAFGFCSDYLGHIDEAFYFYSLCEKLLIGIEDDGKLSKLYNNLSILYRDAGKYETAREYQQKSFQHCKKLGDPIFTIANLANIGRTSHLLGDYENAFHNLQEALDITKQTQNKIPEGQVLTFLGELYRTTGNFNDALKSFNNAIKIFETHNEIFKAAESYNNIGLIYKDYGKLVKAKSNFIYALKISLTVGNKKLEATVLNNIGIVFDESENYEQAMEYYNKSLVLNEKIRHKKGQADVLSNIGSVFVKQEKKSLAKNSLNKALIIQKKINDKAGISWTLSNLAAVELLNEDIEKCLMHAKESYDIAIEVKETLCIYHTGILLGAVLCKQRKIEEGLSILKKSLSIGEENNLNHNHKIKEIIKSFQNQSS